MTPLPESDGESLALSPPVARAADGLADGKPVTAAAIVEAILDRRGSDYAAGAGENLSLAVDDPAHERRTVEAWLDAVRDLFDREVEPQLHGRAVVLGLGLLDPDLKRQLGEEDFLTKLEDEYDKPLAEALTERGHSLWRPPDSVPTQPDRPLEQRTDDRLQRVAFARYLARRISDVSSSKAYSINLYGPWGSGKTTLLNFLEDELESEPPDGQEGASRTDTSQPADRSWQVVRFNAWQHQHVEPPWWALLDNVFQQTKAELRWRDRLSEYRWRLQSGRLKFLLGIVVFAWLGAFAVPPLLGGSATFADLAQFADGLGKVLAVGVTIWAGVEAVTTSLLGRSARAARSYVDFVSDPMNAIEQRFNDLVGRVPAPVAIFVDDLDRCDCEYVVQLLEGIQTLFTDAPVVYVVAADRDWLNNCFEEVYDGQQSAVDTAGTSLGGLFLEKTFQFSTPVPTIPEELKAEYWRSLLQATPGESGLAVEHADPSEAIADAASEEDILRVVEQSRDRSFVEQQSIRTEAVERLASPDIVERTEHLLSPFAPLLDPNPRAMKRLVNAYSVNRALATLGHVDVDREPLALWTILSLQYPELADVLEADPALVNQVGREVVTDVEDDLAALFADENVVAIVNGDPVAAELDEAVVQRCGNLR